MMKNNKGFIGMEIISFLLIIFGFSILFVVFGFTKGNTSFGEGTNHAKTLAEKYIKDVENDGVLMPETKINIIKEFDEEFNYDILVEGPEIKVDTGEQVYIMMTLKSTNLYGGTVREEKIIVEGVRQ